MCGVISSRSFWWKVGRRRRDLDVVGVFGCSGLDQVGFVGFVVCLLDLHCADSYCTLRAPLRDMFASAIFSLKLHS